MTGAQAIAGEEDLRIALALADVVVGALQQLDGSPGSKVGAADTDCHEHIGALADLFCRGLDAFHFVSGLPHRQVQPAQIFAALASAVSQRGMGIGNLLFYRQQVCQRQLAPHVGDINCNHVIGTRPF